MPERITMFHFPTWNWLVSGLSTRQRCQTKSTRPCLPAVEQLDDRILPTVTIKPVVVAPPPQTPPAVTSFIKWQNDFIKLQDSYIKIEERYLKLHGDVLSPDAANFFLKLNADFEAIDADLAGNPLAAGASTAVSPVASPVANGGIDGTLIFRRLSTAQATADSKAVLADAALLNLDDGVIKKGQTNGGNTTDDAIHVYLKLEALSIKLHGAVDDSEAQFLKIEKAFVAVYPDELSKPVASLDGHIIKLDGDTTPMNPAAVDAFIKFEANFIKGESNFIKLEDAFLLKYGGALPQGASDYFIKIDRDYLSVNGDLAAVDAILIGLLKPAPTAASPPEFTGGLANFPTDVSLEIHDKWMPTLSDFNGALQADIKSLTTPTVGVAAVAAVVTPNAVNAYLKFEEIKYKEAIDVVTLDFTFMKLEAGLKSFLEGDPDQPLINGLATDLTTLTKDALGIPSSTGGGTTGNV